MLKTKFTLLLLFFTILLSAQKASSFKFCDDFESENFINGYRNQEITKNNGYNFNFSSKKGRFNDGFLTVYLNETGRYGTPKRSEYGLRLYDSIGMKKFFQISVQITDGLKFDDVNFGREIMIMQWHSKPAPNRDWTHYRNNNPFNRPSIALYLTTNDNLNFYLVLRYGNNGKKDFKYSGEVWSVVALQRIDVNKWYDLTFEIKWSFQNDGYIASYINNEPFTPFNGLHNKVYGANMHNESPVYFKFGQYRYWDDKNVHKIHFDELRVGNSFDEVSLYDDYPCTFSENKSLNFIQNHK
jgi:hypothetical protein